MFGKEKVVPGTIKRVLKKAEFLKKETKEMIKKGQSEGKYYPLSLNQDTDDIEEANIVTSMIDDGSKKPKIDSTDIFSELEEFPNPREVMHAPVLDLDIPHTYVPSTTPGHGHLYLDVPMDHENFMMFLEMLSDFGIIEEGYWKASEARGYSAVRPPWIKKADDE